MKLSNFFFIFCVFCLVPLHTIALQGAEVLVYQSPFSVQQAKYRTERLLKKIGLDKYKAIEQKQGFDFAVKAKPASPFRYKLFIGRWKSKKKALIRLEGNEGHIYTIAQILEKENIVGSGSVLSDEEYENRRKLKRKSYAGVFFLNLLSPTLTAVYEAAESPVLSKRDLTIRGLVLFGVEVGLFYLAGSNFLQTGFNYARYQNQVNNTLLLYRLAYLGFALKSVAAHNRLLKLGYEFAY